MKKILVALLIVLLLLNGCGASGEFAETTDNPISETNSQETASPATVERFDHVISILEDTYVFNKDSENHSDENFGVADEIHLKNGGNSYHRNGYLKFDISNLAGDNDFTSIELDLTLVARQYNSGDPKYATVAVYGCDTNWDETEVTFNKQPVVFSFITKLSDVSNEKITRSYQVTDYIRKALANGDKEVAFMLCDETPETGLHIRFAAKESGTNAPQLSVYYGTKTDDGKYEGLTSVPKPVVSDKGLDSILGHSKVTEMSLAVLEDTFIQGGADANVNFGDSDMLDFKYINSESPTKYHRSILLKFDISQLQNDKLTRAEISLNCFSSEESSKQRELNVYSCDPYSWEEMTVTMNTAPQKEDLLTSVMGGKEGVIRLNVTEYVKQALANGDKAISFFIEGSPETSLRLSFDSSEKALGIAPTLELKYGELSFNTYLEYYGVNPWDKAMQDVSAWLYRWDEIKSSSRETASEIAKDNSEYSIMVGGALSSNTNGANTVYTQYPTRLVSTLNGFRNSSAEKELYDIYGGYTGNGKYGEATGFFYTKKVGNRLWTIDPLGYPFYRVACVEIEHGSSPNQKETSLAQYGNVGNWAKATTDRIRELGFNSTGGWSDIDNLSKVEQPLAQTKILSVLAHFASSKGLNVSHSGGTDLLYEVLPVFDPDFESFANERVKSETANFVNDGYIYGWMSDNELPYSWSMLDNSLALDYEDNRFIYSYATAWTFMYLKTGKTDVSTADVTDVLRDEYRAMVYDKYFEIVKKALDKYAPNHQYIGCRMSGIAYRTESLIRVAGYWCDVISFNYYGKWTPETELLRNIENWGGKPFIVTEWYARGMDAWEADNRMTNNSGAGWTVKNQSDRGKFYQNFALGLMECKACVGFDWFKYWDNDPDNLSADLSNRDSNKGIYSNQGKEYTDLTDYMSELNNQKYAIINFFDKR